MRERASVVERLEKRCLLSAAWGYELPRLDSGTIGQIAEHPQGVVVADANGTHLFGWDGRRIWSNEVSGRISVEGENVWVLSPTSRVRLADGAIQIEVPHVDQDSYYSFQPFEALRNGGSATVFDGYGDPVLEIYGADGQVQHRVEISDGIEIRAMAEAPDGGIYLAGRIGDGAASDGILMKYSPAGVKLWEQHIDGEIAEGITVDSNGTPWALLSQVQMLSILSVARFDPTSGAEASSIRIADDASPLLHAPQTITANGTNLVVQFFRYGLEPGPKTQYVGIVAEGEIVWRYERADTADRVAPVVTSDGRLVISDPSSGIAHPDTVIVTYLFRQGSTFAVPSSAEDDAITVQIESDMLIARRGLEYISTPLEGVDLISCRLGDGNDMLNAHVPISVFARGGRGNDTIITGQGMDTIYGGDEADLILSHGKADSVLAGQGRDTIYGGAGDDSIFGEMGADLIFGNFGNDYLHGGGRDDTIQGGAGDDEIYAGAGVNIVRGGEGADTIYAYGPADQLFGGTGADRFLLNTDQILVKDLEDQDSILPFALRIQ